MSEQTYWLKTHNHLPAHKEHFADADEMNETLYNIISKAEQKYRHQLEKAAKKEIKDNENSIRAPSFAMQDLAKNWKGFTPDELHHSIVILTFEEQDSIYAEAFPENLSMV